MAISDRGNLTEDQSLNAAFGIGQGGNSQEMIFNPSVGGSPGLPICQVAVDGANSRTWLVTLAQQRSTTRLTGGAIIGAPNPDNTVITGWSASLGESASPLKARVQFGTGEMQDRVLIDYPWGGCTFQVSAAVVKVDIPPTFPLALAGNYTIPRVGGFITARENGSGVGEIRPPTYTPPAQQVGATGNFIFLFPNRASMYYATSPSPIATQNWTMRQIDYQSNVISEDATGFYPGVLSGGFGGPRPFLIHPAATALLVVNNDASPRTFQPIFTIDLG